MMNNAQGTVEYLVVVAIIVIIGLTTTSLVSEITNPQNIGTRISDIDQLTSTVSVTDIIANQNSERIYVGIRNNLPRRITITSVTIGDKTKEAYQELFQGTEFLFWLEEEFCTNNLVKDVTYTYIDEYGLTGSNTLKNVLIPCESATTQESRLANMVTYFAKVYTMLDDNNNEIVINSVDGLAIDRRGDLFISAGLSGSGSSYTFNGKTIQNSNYVEGENTTTYFIAKLNGQTGQVEWVKDTNSNRITNIEIDGKGSGFAVSNNLFVWSDNTSGLSSKVQKFDGRDGSIEHSTTIFSSNNISGSVLPILTMNNDKPILSIYSRREILASGSVEPKLYLEDNNLTFDENYMDGFFIVHLNNDTNQIEFIEKKELLKTDDLLNYLGTSFVKSNSNKIFLTPNDAIDFNQEENAFYSNENNNRDRFTILNEDGTNYLQKNLRINGSLQTVKIDSDGNYLLGGNFTQINGITTNNLARISQEGIVDESFIINSMNNGILDLAIQDDGKIIIVGSFTNVNGVTRNRIARLNQNGTLDTTFNPNANNIVNIIKLQDDGKILVGGNFTSITGTTRNRIARLNPDGTRDNPFNPNANGNVNHIEIDNQNRILVGGNFTTIGGSSSNRLARLNQDGTRDTSFNQNLNQNPNHITIQNDGKPLIAANLILEDEGIRLLFRLNLDGSIDTSFKPNPSGWVTFLKANDENKIITAGGFSNIGVINKNLFATVLNPVNKLIENNILVTSNDNSLCSQSVLPVFNDSRNNLFGRVNLQASGTSCVWQIGNNTITTDLIEEWNNNLLKINENEIDFLMQDNNLAIQQMIEINNDNYFITGSMNTSGETQTINYNGYEVITGGPAAGLYMARLNANTGQVEWINQVIRDPLNSNTISGHESSTKFGMDHRGSGFLVGTINGSEFIFQNPEETLITNPNYVSGEANNQLFVWKIRTR